MLAVSIWVYSWFITCVSVYVNFTGIADSGVTTEPSFGSSGFLVRSKLKEYTSPAVLSSTYEQILTSRRSFKEFTFGFLFLPTHNKDKDKFIFVTLHQ